MSLPDLFEPFAHDESLFFKEQRGIIRLAGQDARAFLQKMSTNDVTLLSPQNPIQSCFCDSKGRLVDFVQVFQGEKDELLLVSSQTVSEPLINWLSSYHFIEDLTLTDLDEPSYFWWQITTNLNPIKSTSQFAGHFFSAKLDETANLQFWGHLGQSAPSQTCPNDWWQTLRIAAQIPQFPNEINPKYMPQNVGLAPFIANNKGCYIGQEVIAKAITYQKNPKLLQGAILTYEDYLCAKEGKDLAVPLSGALSSLAPLYWAGKINALFLTQKQNF